MFRNRRACSIDNGTLRVTVLEEGGHIAEIRDNPSGINPLWIPDWPSIEPSQYDAASDNTYGNNAESSLLSGIMGHNLCLDIFGGPSDEEAAAGLPVHGEASLVRYSIQRSSNELLFEALLPLANLQLERRIELTDRVLRIRESVQNLAGIDRPIGWTQHVTMGPPFLQKGKTQFRASAGRSKVFEGPFGPADYLKAGAEFDWPKAPKAHGGTVDLRVLFDAERSSAYTAHLM